MIISSNSGAGNHTKTLQQFATHLNIINDGPAELTVMISGQDVKVLGLEQFEGDFSPFKTIQIQASGPWRYVLEGKTGAEGVTVCAEIMHQVQRQINDPDGIEYEVDEMRSYLNQAHRFLYRLVANYKPKMIAAPAESVNTISGNALIKLLKRPLKILSVRLDDYPLTALDDNEYSSRQGKPQYYDIGGMQELELIPVPQAEYPCVIRYVAEPAVLTEADEVPWPTAFHDLLVEYMTIRAPMRNEFNMAQEERIMSLVHDQIVQLLTGMQPQQTLVQGYFDPIPAVRVRDY